MKTYCIATVSKMISLQIPLIIVMQKTHYYLFMAVFAVLPSFHVISKEKPYQITVISTALH